MKVYYFLGASLIINICFVLYLLIRSLYKKEKTYAAEGRASATDVGKFYDEQTPSFLKVYGEVIQAFRTKNVEILLGYQAEAMELKPGMQVLDAGCGVCGPAIYFAKHTGVHVHALTISSVQVEMAKENIRREYVTDYVEVKRGDYHELDQLYPAESMDVIYFLESFGHATDHLKVLDAAWKVLKPGGLLYIKDLFLKVPMNAEMEKGIKKEADNINRAYRYNIPELPPVLHHVRKKGYVLSGLKTIDIPLEEFENLTISNEFQELTGINKIENLRDYVFPVDFFELKCIKPWNNVFTGNSRYFLQNLYLMQVENWEEKDL